MIEREMAWLVAQQFRRLARQLVVLYSETEHSTKDDSARSREMSDARCSTNNSEPNTPPEDAQCCLSATGVSD
jgi:hypothetical protein